jgi:hypothetical protein
MANGLCHLCGTFGPLTFEHVPPSAAFNDHRVLEADIYKLIGSDSVEDLKNPQGKINQRGSGKHTLCHRCNNDTGGWYGRAYVEFARRLFPICHTVQPNTFVELRCLIKPLNVFKQMLVMFCSASPPSFAQKHPQLVRYLLNRESVDCDDLRNLRLFMSLYDLNNSNASRQAGITGRIELGSPRVHVYSEISFPPFNLVRSLSGTNPEPRLFDISWFAQFRLNERQEVKLRLHNLAVNSYFPGDYRTFDELSAIVAENRRQASE